MRTACLFIPSLRVCQYLVLIIEKLCESPTLRSYRPHRQRSGYLSSSTMTSAPPSRTCPNANQSLHFSQLTFVFCFRVRTCEISLGTDDTLLDVTRKTRGLFDAAVSRTQKDCLPSRYTGTTQSIIQCFGWPAVAAAAELLKPRPLHTRRKLSFTSIFIFRDPSRVAHILTVPFTITCFIYIQRLAGDSDAPAGGQLAAAKTAPGLVHRERERFYRGSRGCRLSTCRKVTNNL